MATPSSLSTRFPLDADKLPRLHVDRETVKWWKQQARLEITALLQDRESWYFQGRTAVASASALECVFNANSVRGYAESAPASHRSAFFADAVLNITLDDVAYALYCDNSVDQRTLARNLLQTNYLDSAVLDVLERKTLDDPIRFAGTKWLAYTIPPGLVAPQELLCFELSCKTRDVDGHVVLVQYTLSPHFDAEQLDHHAATDVLARAFVHQITTFRSTDAGTHVQSAGSLEASRKVPSWVVAKSLELHFTSLTRLVGLADARAIAALGSAPSLSTARVCFVCSKKLSVLHKRCNCKACGQSICSKCTIKLRVLLDRNAVMNQQQQQRPTSRSVKASDCKFCLPCVLHAREQRPESGGSSLSDIRPSMDFIEDDVDDDDDSDDLDDLDDLDDSDVDEQGSGIIDRLNLHDVVVSFEAPRDRRQRHVQPHRAPRNDARLLRKQLPGAPLRTSSDPSQDAMQRRLRPPQQHRRDERSNRDAPSTHRSRLNHQPVYVELGNQHAPLGQLPIPTPPAPVAPPLASMPAAFSQLSQSIAAQEALLQTIQLERQKFHAQQQMKQHARRRRRHQSLDSIDDTVNEHDDNRDDGRFEVLSDQG